MTGSHNNLIRTDLLDCFQMALQAVNGRECVKAYFAKQLNLPQGKLAMVAIGKAAVAMSEGAIQVFDSQISQGLVITKAGYAEQAFASHPHIEIIESAHPVPDARSLAAGQRLIGFLETLPDAMPVLFLISGGSSALVEVLPEGIELADLQMINTKMLAAGLSIAEMNRVRKAISLIKGGGLLDYIGERPVINLLLSDVPGNDPAVIGSGLLINTPQAINLPQNLPDKIVNVLLKLENNKTTTNCQTTRKATLKEMLETSIIADNQKACEAAADCATNKGYPVKLYPGCLTADVNHTAEQIINQLNSTQPGIHIWGGEPTVCLPEKTGRGGRNQHLALLLARRIKGLDNFHILVAATDGSDGPTDDAGGLVDGQTIMRGGHEGFNVKACLDEANAGAFLEASGDLISTGPTGSNVMDLIIACKT